MHVASWRGFQEETENVPNFGELHDNRLVLALAIRSLDLNCRQSFQRKHGN